MTVPTVGAVAPDFTLDSTSGEKVTLSSFRGKRHVLLAFFPAAFSGTCTAEMCAFTDDWSAFEGHAVAVIPISVDGMASLKEFKAKHAMKVDLVSDFKRDVSRAYGVLDEDRFWARRSYFLVDRDGVVRWCHVEAKNPERRENSELLSEIAKLPR